MERTVLVRPARAATLVRPDGQLSSRGVEVWLALAFSAGGDGGRKTVWGRIANAKSLGYAIYAVGLAIWLFGYLSAGHPPVFDWRGATPWWMSSLVPNLEAELGMVLMFASVIPIYWGAVRKRAFAYTALLIFTAVTLAWWWFLAWFVWHVI